MKLEIDLGDLSKFIQDLDQADDIILKRAKQTMTTAGTIVFQQLIRGHTPVNFGHLRQSINFSINGTPLGYDAQVATSLIYGETIEKGLNPGQPPTEEIELWVRRKGIASGPEARGIAYVIARAIGEGRSRFQRMGGFRMFDQGFEQGLPIVQKLWIDMQEQVIRDLAK